MEQRSFLPGFGEQTERRIAGRAAKFAAIHHPPSTIHLFWLLLLTVGCQPALKYENPAPSPPPAKSAGDDKPPPKDPVLPIGWLDARPATLQAPVAIQFVHQTDGDEWTRLPTFWNPPPTPEQKTAGVFLSPLTAAWLAQMNNGVKIKTPAGLDNPRDFLPPANPPTLGQWRLGKRLFYDKTWLSDRGESCASCHDPHTAFADNAHDHFGVNTPTLVNCVFNRRQFWDGRVETLEEVVQRTVEDETAPAQEPPPFRHVWSGGGGRLRANAGYRQPFLNVFGQAATQDAVGKALATYLRTLLAADSVHDRALAEQAAQHGPELKAEHYQKALNEADLKKLGFEEKTKADAAKRIYQGYRLFYDLEARKTGCAVCHKRGEKGNEFTDGKFHNLGVAFKAFEPGQEPGRFSSLPLGLKDRTLIGAYKTPTLRGLSRTAPYFHDGSAATLAEAVRFHADGGQWNDYLDAELRARDLPDQELADLVLFLRALDGEDVDKAVGPP
jgi:cytochrome c peroxidase